MDIPSAIQRHLFENLHFPEQKICAQVATQSTEGPHLRTMKLVDIRASGDLIFLTNLTTQKWQDLILNPQMAILIYDQNSGVQILSRGTVTLATIAEQPDMVNLYWQKVRFAVKKVFYEKAEEVNQAVAPNHFGVITLRPVYWEILMLDQEDYALSIKYGYERTTEGWQEKQYQVKS